MNSCPLRIEWRVPGSLMSVRLADVSLSIKLVDKLYKTPFGHWLDEDSLGESIHSSQHVSVPAFFEEIRGLFVSKGGIRTEQPVVSRLRSQSVREPFNDGEELK